MDLAARGKEGVENTGGVWRDCYDCPHIVYVFTDERIKQLEAELSAARDGAKEASSHEAGRPRFQRLFLG